MIANDWSGWFGTETRRRRWFGGRGSCCWRRRVAAEGIAAAVGKSLLTVRRWRRRYVAKGVDGLLKDATRPPRRKPLTAEKIKQVVDMTLHAKPPNATHWSLRSMAAAAGLSHSSIQRIWARTGSSRI